MSHRCTASMGVVVAVIAIVSLAPVPVAAQAQAAGVDTRTPPRTAWGEPDLRGIWDFRTITPLERPSELAGKQVLTKKEADELEEQAAQSRIERDSSEIPDRCIGSPNFVDCIGSYNQYWFDRGTEVIAHGPEDRRVGAHCLVGFNSGPPMNPSAYNNNKRPRRIRERTPWRRFGDALPAARRTEVWPRVVSWGSTPDRQ